MIEQRDLLYWKNQIIKYDKNVSFSLENKEEREMMSEKLLDGLRHFVDSIMCYIREANFPREYYKRYDEIEDSKKYCRSKAEYNFIVQFDDNLNGSIGHQDMFGEYAERVFLKYYSYLIRIKELFKSKFSFNILGDLNKYPIDLDDSFVSYYRMIIKTLSKNDISSDVSNTDSFYIQKKKMLYVDGIIFYEYTLTNATDNNNRFDRFIAFSLLNIPLNYAVKAKLIDRKIKFFEQNIDYYIIVSFKVAIRPCELDKLSYIVGINAKFNRSKEYWNLMDYLTIFSVPLNVILESSNDIYHDFLIKVFVGKKETALLRLINACRQYLMENKVGSNVLRYLLYKTNNNIIKSQLPSNEDDCLSSINLSKRVFGFDKKPFTTCPINHVPRVNDLLEVFDASKHKPELIAKSLIKKSIENSCIYIHKDNFKTEEIDEIVKKYNHEFSKANLLNRRILSFGKYLYLSENEENTRNIISMLLNMINQENFPDYENYIEEIITSKCFVFTDPDKEKSLRRMFIKSSLFVVYGPAGSGKSYFANYVLRALDDVTKVCIASTNPAVENMRRKFDDNTAEYLTITKYLNKYRSFSKIGLLVIDECSTISAKEMMDILTKTSPSLILLLGDTYQIKPISFGNWFSILCKFIPSKSYVDLNNQYRCSNKILLSLWNEVRNLGKNIKELLSSNEISHKFDSSIFKQFDKDEIILCLNYDGLYGINNLNRVLQKNNPNKEYRWKQYIFKTEDPIIFDDNPYYKGVFYNNLKGVIKGIEENNDSFVFTVKINKIVTSIACSSCNIEYIGLEDDGTIVAFEVKKFGEDYYDNDSSDNTHFPFQVAYALSIHKAQGLEYNSVKIIISNEVEEQITHSIFYTAITRAKKILNIYWTPESEEKIINSFYIENCDNDANILAARFPELKIIRN